eukprot:gene19895-25850_t
MSMLSRAIGAKAYGLGVLSMSFLSPIRSTHSEFCASKLSETQIKNPLLNKQSLPKFSEIETVHVKSAVEVDLNYLNENFSEFESELKKRLESQGSNEIIEYSSVIEKLEQIQYPLSYSWGVVGHLMGVKNSEELRQSHDEIQPNVIQSYQKIGQSKTLYQSLLSIRNNPKIWDTLAEAQQRIITSNIRSMESSGVGLDDASREIFNKLKLESAELSTKFSNNVLDSTKAFKLIITDPNDITGLPESAKGSYLQNAIRNGYPDATIDKGPWVITLDMPSYLPAMQHLQNRKLREELYRAAITKASSGETDNSKIIQRIIQIKTEVAKLLGYKCYAELSLSSKMAPNVDSVLQLIDMLYEKSYPIAEQELEELKAFAKENGFTEELSLWDVPYWSERMREKLYNYEEEALRPYFALPNVLDGLFSLANRLFDISIENANGEAQVWNQDVQYFKIKDNKSGDYIASFYLDPYSRPADKRGGAWMDTCLGKSKVLNTKPVAYLTCNGSPPVGEQPSLMTFREVETLFHEFGHGLQHMLTTVEHADAAGINNVEWDAVELPSQFMENWCFDKKTLYSFAKHYQTNEPLPLELFEKIKNAKNFQAGIAMMRQLFFGAMDIELYSEKYDAFSNKTPFELQQELAKKYTVIPPLPEDRFLCSFGHIFAGGYSAGYYSYKWAEVMSADAFGAFEEGGLENEEKVREIGKRFRDTVLSLGGGKSPSEVFKLFRNRDPSPEALLRHSGLTK